MPNFPRPKRRDESAISDESLAALLAGTQPPEDVPAELRPALDVLAALRAGPARDEVTDEATVLAEFRSQTGAGKAWRRDRRRSRRRAPLVSLPGKFAAAALVAAVGVAGVAAVAISGTLPASFQRVIHDTVPALPLGGGGKTQAQSARRVGDHPAASRHHRGVSPPPAHKGRHHCAPFPWSSLSAHPSQGTSARRIGYPVPCRSGGPSQRWPRRPGHLRKHWLRRPDPLTKPLPEKTLPEKTLPGTSDPIRTGRPGHDPVRKLVPHSTRGLVSRSATTLTSHSSDRSAPT